MMTDQADEKLNDRPTQDQGSHEAISRHSGWSKPGGLQTSHEEKKEQSNEEQ